MLSFAVHTDRIFLLFFCLSKVEILRGLFGRQANPSAFSGSNCIGSKRNFKVGDYSNYYELYIVVIQHCAPFRLITDSEIENFSYMEIDIWIYHRA